MEAVSLLLLLCESRYDFACLASLYNLMSSRFSSLVCETEVVSLFVRPNFFSISASITVSIECVKSCKVLWISFKVCVTSSVASAVSASV